MCLTIEPGCYFVERLLNGAKADPALSGFVHWDVLDRFRGSGGVRLEDVAVVTAEGSQSLTVVPREVNPKP